MIIDINLYISSGAKLWPQMTARVRFDWEDAVAHDVTLQRIDAYVKLTISKLPGQPAPQATNTKGSRYEPLPPSVKAEQLSTATTSTPVKPEATPERILPSGATPQYINIRDYLSESSSEVDTREVNPMDELSDFEPGSAHAHSIDQDQAVDVEMADEKSATACEVCKNSDREDEIILCDECNAEYHIFCLEPPLQKVPDEAWYCIKCCVQYAGTPGVQVKSEQSRHPRDATARMATTTKPVASSPATATGAAMRNDPTSIPVRSFTANGSISNTSKKFIRCLVSRLHRHWRATQKRAIYC